MKRTIFVTILIFTFCLAFYGQTNSSVCPQISLVTPEKVLIPNSPVFFAAEISGNTGKQLFRYNWSFSSGKILEGQDTAKIKFVVEDQENTNVHVRLKVNGLPEKCSSVFEDTVGILPPLQEDPYDKFEKINPNDLKARLDALMVMIEIDPESNGLIQIIFDKKDSRKYQITRFQNILRHFEFRKYDLNRVIIAYSIGEQEKTIHWIWPLDVKLPKFVDSNYKIIQGQNLRKEINNLSSKQ